MTRLYADPRTYKPIVGAVTAGFVVVILISWLAGVMGQEFNFLDAATWVVLEVLRPVMLADGQFAAACCECLEGLLNLLQIVASVCPLLCFLAG